MNTEAHGIDEILSTALGDVNPSSTSKNKYRRAITLLEAALRLRGLMIKSLGAPKNYGNRISEATGTGANALVLVADEKVDREALVRAYVSRAVRPVPALLVVKTDGQCKALEVITEEENPFPQVEVCRVATNCGPKAPDPGLVAEVLQLDGCRWVDFQLYLDEHQDLWGASVLVKHAPDQKNLLNRIREAAGRRPSLLIVSTSPDLRVSCGAALEDLADLVGEAIVVTDGREYVHVELASVAADALRAGPSGMLQSAEIDPFVAWNAVLLRDFFSPTHAGEEVTLSVSRPELDDIAPELGGFDGLLDAVGQGPPWQLPSGRALTTMATGLVTQRASPSSRPPSYVHPTRYIPYGQVSDNFPNYLPILAALVALCVEYQHGEGGFYHHAQQRLGLGPRWGPAELAEINRLWSDLESWTTETGGKFGIFKMRELGGRSVLGKLKSQSIIRASDIYKLHELFAAIDFTPGEPTPRARVAEVLQRIHDRHVLSQGIRDAARQRDFRSALIDRLDQVLRDWDGTTTSERERSASSTTRREYARLGVALFANRGRPPWTLGWRVPPLHDDGRISLGHGEEALWRAMFDGTPYAVARPYRGSAGRCEFLLSEVSLAVTFEDGFRPSTRGKSLTWTPLPLTVLEYSRRHDCLVELDTLPASGTTYLLVSPTNRNFDHVVQLERIELTPVGGHGLPDGWRLFFLRDAASLNTDQRDLLPGTPINSPSPRAIRLVGGLRIRRAGRIAYLPHDLPIVEVDAPLDCEVRAPGLSLTSIDPVVDNGEGRVDVPKDESLQASTRRLFEVQVDDDDLMTFTLSVVTPEGRTLGTTNLRLAIGTTEPANGDIELVPVCRPAHGRLAIQGMAVNGKTSRPELPTLLDVGVGRLGLALPISFAKSALDCPEVRFLDALAKVSGKMSYGRACNVLRRYLADQMRDIGTRVPRTVTATFQALRQRGMLELQSDSRGRWTTVGAVRPALYALSISVGGDEIWGVSGTLNLEDWRHLFATGAEIFVTHESETSLPVLRLRGAVSDPGRFEIYSRPPAAELAECSSSLKEIGDSFSSRGFEALDERAHDREWFRPQGADWRDSTPPRDFDWVLLRYTDPDTGRHRLHSLRSGVGEHRYRHVRNERWATWMAYDSCVRHFDKYLPGVAPWPLSYHSMTHSLWIPERMRLPLILERALVACSGAPPAKVMLVRDPQGSGRFLRGCTESMAFKGTFDPNYDKFLPADAARSWLEYRYIPRLLVETVADRLGCRVDDEIGDLR